MDGANILIIYHKIGYGGANKMITFVANALASSGFNVMIYTYSSDEEPEYQLNDSIQLIKETEHYGRSIKDRIHQVNKIINILKITRPKVVLSFMSTSNLYAIFSTRIFEIPTIISERGNPESEKRLISRIKQLIMRFSEGAVFQTEGAKKFFPKKLQNRSIIIPNPVIKTTIAIDNWNSRKKEISFVARFEVKQKRHDLILLAFQKVIEQYPEYKLCFYGDGEDLEEIIKLTEKLGLQSSVIFKGKVDNVVEQISKSKIFVLTSDYEGIPNALIEAMSIGLPCVSTDCRPGGARLLIENKVNGIIVPTGDHEAISEAILFMLDNPEEATKMGNEALAISERFSENVIADEWVNYTNSIIKKYNSKKLF